MHEHPHLPLFSYWSRKALQVMHFFLSNDVFPVSVLRLGSLFVLLFSLSMYVRIFFRAQDAPLYSVCMRMCVLVRFIPTEDSFPQQALSGCFWAHSVHSWRQLLSPAYLTSLLSLLLLSSPLFPQFLLLTLMSVATQMIY